MENDKKEGFTVICNKCGSQDVTKMGTDGFGVYIYCNNCDNEEG